jgi:APA family basic amino acid/polyamine antiporter
MMDAFAVGFMNQGLTPSIWFTITLGLGVFMGGNLIIACILSALLAGIGFPIVWGVLGGSMPRSGGEYVYNSRIIHPIYGIAQSFGDAAIWLMWIFVLAPLAVNPGLTTTFGYLGWNSASNWLSTGGWWRGLLIATLFNILGFLFVVFGIKIFALTQKIVMFFGIGGCAVIGIVLTFSSHANFVNKWNAAAAATHSADYNAFIAKVGEAAGKAVPLHWSWGPTFGVMVAMSWLFAYAYSISFIGGEVKRPDKTIIWANVFAIVVPFVFMMWFAIVLNRTVGYQFLNASAWNDNNGGIPAVANMPHTTNVIDLAVYAIGTSTVITKIVAAVMGFSYVAFTLWWIALSYLAFPRILFAWGMDRMGPKWFTDINPKWASPVKN